MDAEIKPDEHDSKPAKAVVTLRTLFGDVSADHLREIEETLHAFCSTAWRIYERLERERPEVIDEVIQNRRINAKVDSLKIKETE